MRVTVLGSGSRGNAVCLTAAGVTLLLDAGFGPRTILHRARQAGVDLASIIGVLLTHEHGDHARGAAAVARLAGCPIYASPGTFTALAGRLGKGARVVLDRTSETPIGPFRVATCRTVHDAAEPLAVTVTGPAPGVKVGLAYDLGRPTGAVRLLLRDVTCLLLEANHDEILLRTGDYPAVVRERIGGSRGHLSNRAAGELLAQLCHRRLSSVVLLHLSEQCNRPDLAEMAVRTHLERAGYRGRLLVAKQGAALPALHLASETRQLELGLA